MRRIFRFFLHFSPSPLVHLAPMASAACRRPSLSRPLEPLGCSLPGRRRPPDCRRHRQLVLIAPPRALLRAFPWAPPPAVGLLVDAAGNGSEPSRSFASVRRGRKGRQPPAGTSRHYGRREVCLLHARAVPSLLILRGFCLRFGELHLDLRGMWRGFTSSDLVRLVT